jgi:uncharacterized protein YjbI with pentapeptide repeats
LALTHDLLCLERRLSARGTALRGADLRGANLDGIDLREVELQGVRIDFLQAVLLARCHGAEVDAE